ncbi:MAG: SGNH/GDSL hydrolase family protein [Flavobacteriales bacterium]
MGNSVTAQKEGYKKFLSESFDQSFSLQHQYINAGIGGVGSLASLFLMDDFVLRYQPDICFVECTVADIGAATPMQYIASSVEGIAQKLLSKGIYVCFLHLYNSHTSEERIHSITSLYEEIAEHYNLPSVNVGKAVNDLLQSGEYVSTDIVYDGIHTTLTGAQLTARFIFSALKEMITKATGQHVLPQRALFYPSFRYTQIVVPSVLMTDNSRECKQRRFRSIIKYLEIGEHNFLRFTPTDGSLVGLLVIADEESGVVAMESNARRVFVQTYDQWCDKERIQAIILDEICAVNTEFSISLSQREEGDRGANGPPNRMKKRGKTLKIAGLMVLPEKEPQNVNLLW